MRTKYNGVCFRCHKQVPAGQGDFQSIASLPKEIQRQYYGQNRSFVVRCFGCKQKGNIPLAAPTKTDKQEV